MTTVPPVVAGPAQEIVRGSSVDGSTVATPQPQALEVKTEGHLDSQDEAYGVSNSAARSSSVTGTVNAKAGVCKQFH